MSNPISSISLFTSLFLRVLIPAVYKKDTHLELHFFNNCFDDDRSKGVKSMPCLLYKRLRLDCTFCNNPSSGNGVKC